MYTALTVYIFQNKGFIILLQTYFYRRELDQFLKVRKLDLAKLRFQEITSCTAEDARYKMIRLPVG